jgi:hypothetical protein
LIEDGKILLERLDKQDVPVEAAVWAYQPDRETWTLVVVTDVAKQPGPLEAYTRIQTAMTGLDLDLALDDILVMSPDSHSFAEFRRAMEGVARLALARGGSSAKGLSFDDAYFYRWPGE